MGLVARGQRTRAIFARDTDDDLIDDGVSERFLAVEIVVERALGDFRSGENAVQPRSLISAAIYFAAAVARAACVCVRGRAPGIAFLVEGGVRGVARSTYQPVCMFVTGLSTANLHRTGRREGNPSRFWA